VLVPSRVGARRARHASLVELPGDAATLRPASRCSKIHRTCGAVAGSGSSRCSRCPTAHARGSGAQRRPPAGPVRRPPTHRLHFVFV
jgi:hypothetical protein